MAFAPGTEIFVELTEGTAAWCSIIRLIGEGGAGSCYLARCAERAQDLVIKAPRDGSSAALTELERELDLVRRVQHEGVIRLLGLGSAPDGSPFLAFERAQENPLLLLNAPGRRARLSRDPRRHYCPLPPGVALELGFELLRALERMHALGLVHQDVKLSNLMIVPGTVPPRDADDAACGDQALLDLATGDYRAALIDLGAARSFASLEAVNAGREERPPLTPLYAPPEALLPGADGRALLVPSLDVYAAALVVYVMLTGERPYARWLDERPALEDVLDVKAREARGELTPFREEALRDLPLQDVLTGGASVADATLSFLRDATAPHGQRHDATRAREALEWALRFRAPEGGAGRWTQATFRLDPRHNRLLEASGRRPSSGDPSSATARTLKKPGPADLAAARPRPRFEGWAHVPGARPLEAFLEEARGLTREEYLRDHPHPLLVTDPPTSEAERALARVIEVQKRDDLPVEAPLAARDERRVSIGRAPWNDVAIPCESVSKRHATVARRAGAWEVADCGSANGTVVDGSPLAEGQRRSIGDVARVELGPDIVVDLYSPEAAYDLVQRLKLRRADATPCPSTPATRVNPFADTRRRDLDVALADLDGALQALRGMEPVIVSVEVDVDVARLPLRIYERGVDEDLGEAVARLPALGNTIIAVRANVDFRAQPVVVYERAATPSSPPT